MASLDVRNENLGYGRHRRLPVQQNEMRQHLRRIAGIAHEHCWPPVHQSRNEVSPAAGRNDGTTFPTRWGGSPLSISDLLGWAGVRADQYAAEEAKRVHPSCLPARPGSSGSMCSALISVRIAPGCCRPGSSSIKGRYAPRADPSASSRVLRAMGSSEPKGSCTNICSWRSSPARTRPNARFFSHSSPSALIGSGYCQ
jgi:hypothetical protein